MIEKQMADEELVAKVQEWVNKLCATGGRAWSLRVPVDFERDPDMLITELCKRFSESRKGMFTEEMIDDIIKIVVDEVGIHGAMMEQEFRMKRALKQYLTERKGR